MKPVWDGKEFVPRLMLPLSLSYDHRVIDGALGRALHRVTSATLLADVRRCDALNVIDAKAAMSSTSRVKVPDIGDFKDVPVIEILVKPGDAVKAEDPLITLESDKATMDVPSPAAGTVKEVKVKLGDKVAEGMRDPHAGDRRRRGGRGGRARSRRPQPAAASAAAVPPPAAAAPIPGAATYAGKADIECEMLVLGAGPGGYSAAFRAADLGLKTVLVERYPTLGGVCLNVGCIPSKALLHVAAVIDEAEALAEHGITFGAPQIDLDKLRGWKDKVVGKLTGGLAGMAKARKVEVVRGVGQFLDPHHVEVELTTGPAQDKTGEKKVVRFDKAIIAAGSQVVSLPFTPCPTIRGSSTPPARWSCARSRSGCWSSAAASSASRWPPSTRRWARASTSSRCSTR